MTDLIHDTPPADIADPWLQVQSALCQCVPPFPAATVAWAQDQRESLAAPLLAVLDKVSADPEAATQDEATLFNWAFVLLAVWRDTRAWAPMLAVLRRPLEQVEDLLGDMLTECYGRALASVCPGDVEPLQAMVQDESLSVWSRIALLHAWRLRVMHVDAPRLALEDGLLHLGDRCVQVLTSDAPDDLQADADVLLGTVIGHAGRLRSERLRPAVKRWFSKGVVDPMSITPSDYEREMGKTHDWPDVDDRHEDLVNDASRETRWWACWHEPSALPAEPVEPAFMPWAQVDDPAPTTFVRDAPKVGRNDPCPCGSGLKFKKCHGG